MNSHWPSAVCPVIVRYSFFIRLDWRAGLDYLVTWNCQHIAGGRVRAIVQRINERRGIATPVICTPEQLMEV